MSSSNKSVSVKKQTLEDLVGVYIDPQLLRSEQFAARYPMNNNCNGYCRNMEARKVALVAALDVAVVKGIAGADLFVDFKSDG